MARDLVISKTSKAKSHKMKTTILTTLLLTLGLFLAAQNTSSEDFITMSNGDLEIGQEESPVYNGPTGCNRPLHYPEFDALLKNLHKQPFEKDKLSKAKQIVQTYCLNSGQVKQIMLRLSFEEHRLEFAQFAYPHTYDLDNFDQVHGAFKFMSSIQKLKESIR
jgi:hypothetical protein